MGLKCHIHLCMKPAFYLPQWTPTCAWKHTVRKYLCWFRVCTDIFVYKGLSSIDKETDREVDKKCTGNPEENRQEMSETLDTKQSN